MTGQRILVVDDSPSMRQLIIDTLERAGYEPVEAVDGEDGLARARDEGPIDLALVDFNMPRLDGLAVIRGLRAGEGTRYIPILVVTTETRRERRDAAREAGATGWIVKPFQEAILLETVRRLLPVGRPGGAQ